MHRSALLLLISALLLSAAVGLPLSLEESAEQSWLDLLLEDVWDSDELLDSGHENAIHKRAARDASSSSEEHKDKPKDKANSSGASSSEEQKTTTEQAAEESTTQVAVRRRRAAKNPSSSSEEHKDTDTKNSSGDSSSEEQKTTTQATARRRRSNSLQETCSWLTEKLAKGEELSVADFELDTDIGILCFSRLTDLYGEMKRKKYVTERFRRQVSDQEQQRVHKASGELELDAQAEKELDEEMARAVADVKDNGSIEDYAQGCEVMEVSSKEANEATYAE